MALQGLDTDDIEGCEFSEKFRAETSGDNYGKTNGMCRTSKSSKLLEISLTLLVDSTPVKNHAQTHNLQGMGLGQPNIS